MCNCNCSSPTLAVGDTLYGFAGGKFGSSSYGPRLVIHVANDWVVYVENGYKCIWTGNPSELVEFTVPEPEEDY